MGNLKLEELKALATKVSKALKKLEKLKTLEEVSLSLKKLEENYQIH